MILFGWRVTVVKVGLNLGFFAFHTLQKWEFWHFWSNYRFTNYGLPPCFAYSIPQPKGGHLNLCFLFKLASIKWFQRQLNVQYYFTFSMAQLYSICEGNIDHASLVHKNINTIKSFISWRLLQLNCVKLKRKYFSTFFDCPLKCFLFSDSLSV